MINKKLSDLFLRKQNHRKEESKQPVCFDQSFFHCRLISRGINTDLIRLQSQVKESGQPLDQIKCKWFIKNSHDFKEIQGVTSEYYQPCLDDVGSIICVQIEPFIEGKKYTGITIMKESEVVEIDHKLEDQLAEFLDSKYKKLDGRIEAVFSQNEKYEFLQLPLQIKMQIKQRELFILNNGEILETITITSQYPNVQFNRKSFNSIILNFNERQSFRLSFFNNYSRDLFTLMIRTLAAHSEDINPEVSATTTQAQQLKQVIDQASDKQPEEEKQCSQNNIQKISSEQTIEEPKIQEEKEKSQQIVVQTKIESSNSIIEPIVENSPVKTQKNEESKQSNTMMILRLDQQNKELKTLRRQYEQLKVNYNIEKQSKKKLQIECDDNKKKFEELTKKYQDARKICSKMDKVYEDNRFYKNELSIMKKQMKSLKQKIVQLESKAKDKANEQSNEFQQKIKRAIDEKNMIENTNYSIQKARQQAEIEVERLKQQLQRIQNDNQTLKKKLESLQSEKKVNNFQTTASKIQMNGNDTRVQDLEMKLKNLEMLLRYKSNQGDVSSNLQILVNKLTQTISQKEIQMNELKKINKNLLMQLKQLKQSKGK